MSFDYLVVSSETPEQAASRRDSRGASAAGSYAAMLRVLEPGARCDTVNCVDGSPLPDVGALHRFDAVFLAGSPIRMHEDTPQTRGAASFMRTVFASGVPCFGSCAGLQIAVVAAGGTAKPRAPNREAAFARGIVATDAGRRHPLLADRPIVWDAPAMHADEVDCLPPHATVLATSRTTRVQAAEIRHDGGVFWGVQYHPELTLAEIAISLRESAQSLVEEGIAPSVSDLQTYAERIMAAGENPERRDLAWMLGLDDEVTDGRRRTAELRAFIRFARGRRAEAA